MNFDNISNLKKLPCAYLGFPVFSRLLDYLNTSVYCLVLKKVKKYQEPLSPKVRLAVDYLLDMLLNPLPLSIHSRAAGDLLGLVRNPKSSSYVQYQFLMKHILLKTQKKKRISCLPLSKLEVFSSFFSAIFELEARKKKVNSFLMYSFLRFASFIESPERVSLIRRFGQFRLLARPPFWQNILFFMSKYVYYFMNSKDQMESVSLHSDGPRRPAAKSPNPRKGLFQKIEDFFDETLVKIPKKVDVPVSRIKSYQDISELLMNMGLELPRITDILLELGQNCGIPLKHTTSLLNKNQRVFNQHFSTMNGEVILVEDVLRDSQMKKFYAFSDMKFGRGKLVSNSHEYLSFRERKSQISDKKAFGIFTIIKLVLPFLVGNWRRRVDRRRHHFPKSEQCPRHGPAQHVQLHFDWEARAKQLLQCPHRRGSGGTARFGWIERAKEVENPNSGF